MIVQLPGGSMVNTDHVVSISRDFYNRYLIVKTVLGDTFEVQPVYGQSIFDAETKLLAAMNADGKGGAA